MSSVPIDVFTKKQYKVIIESLKEAVYNARLEEFVKQNIDHVMSTERFEGYFDKVGITAGDESVPKKRHQLNLLPKTIHVYFRVYIRSIGSFELIINNEGRYSIDILDLRVDPPSEDDYLGAKVLSEQTISLEKLYSPTLRNKVKRIERVLEDQWRVTKQLELLRSIVDEANKLKGRYRLVLALMDGSILPWELDMDITPGSRFFNGLPSDLADAIITNERKIMRGFNDLFSEVYNSNNVVLVGAVKKSRDWTLQSMIGRVPSKETPDQVLLSDIMEEGTIFKSPFRQHRFKTFIAKLDKFDIKHEDYIVDTYYVRRDLTTYPLKLEVLLPKGFPTDVASVIPHLLAHLIMKSERHTYINMVSGGSMGIPTLLPIYIVDKKARDRGVTEITETAYVIDKEWERISDALIRCAYLNKRCVVSKDEIMKFLGGGE